MASKYFVRIATFLYVLLILASLAAVINEAPLSGHDYDSYWDARTRLLNGEELYILDNGGVIGDLTYRYHPVYLLFLLPKTLYILVLFGVYLLSTFVLFKKPPFNVKNAVELLIVTANSLWLISASAGNYSGYLILYGTLSSILLYQKRWPVLAGLALLPIALTKPHWVVWFLIPIIFNSRRYIWTTITTLFVSYVLCNFAFVAIFGTKYIVDYYTFLFDGSAVQGAITGLPTIQQGITHWMVYLFGDNTVTLIAAYVLKLGILITFVRQVFTLWKERDTVDKANSSLYLIAFTYLSVMLVLPDMQVLELWVLAVLVLVRYAPRTLFLRLIFLLCAILAAYPVNGIIAAFGTMEGSAVYAVLMYILYSPAVLVIALLLWIALLSTPIKNLGESQITT